MIRRALALMAMLAHSVPALAQITSYEQAMALSKAGKHEEALAALERELSFEPGSEIYRTAAAKEACTIAEARYARSDAEEALKYARLAVKHMSRLGCGHMTLGRIYADRYELSDAVRELTLAEADTPEAVVLRRRAEVDAKGPAPAQRGSSQNFSARLFGQAPSGTVNGVLDAMESARLQVRDQLGITTEGTLVLLVYAGREYQAGAQAPEWSSGRFEGKIRVNLGNDDPAGEAFRRRLMHEYSHAALRTESRGCLPAWVDEGLAMIAAGGRPGAAERVRASASGLPLSKLHESFNSMTAEEAAAAYDVAFAATAKLDSEFGRPRLIELVRSLGAGKSFDASFEDIFSRPYARFDAELRKGL